MTAAARSRSRIGEVVPLIFANPFVTVRRVEAALKITKGTKAPAARCAEGSRPFARTSQSRLASDRWSVKEVACVNAR